MEKQTVVVLLGSSVLMDGVAVSLAGNEQLNARRIDPSAPNLQRRLSHIKPDLIVFELDTVCSSSILSLLREQPGSLLLGLDSDCSSAIVINSRKRLTRSMEELYELLQDEVGATRRA